MIKILLLDIETAPNTAYVWGLWKQNISIEKIVESSYVMCWAAKWLGSEEIQFDSVKKSSSKEMLEHIHKLLDEADAVIHYYGSGFDIPVLNKEFIKHKMRPPSPYKQIDLYRVAKARFKFASNKLDYIAHFLGLGKKAKHEGMELWIKCMRLEPEAWVHMEEYNKQDVRLLEKVYNRFLPWITNSINRSLFTESVTCPNCGSGEHQKRGFYYSNAAKYQRFNCKDCGNWFRSGSTLAKGPKERATNVS